MRGPTLALLLAALVAGCGPAAAAPEPVELTVFAAASLAPALEEVEVAYERANPGIALVVATDSSATLATQIVQGAPADAFLSADEVSPDRLIRGGFAVGPAVPFAGNSLVVIVPAENPARIRTPADLARPGVRVIGAGDQVPITRYADEVVRNLADLAGYPATFPVEYARNVVSREDNVAAIAARIQLGEGDAGIVYRTDAAASQDVEIVAISDAANVRATYTAVIVAGSRHKDEARAFLDWLVGPDGAAILARFGFVGPAL